MDVNKGLVVGAGCLLVGLVLGYSMGGSDTDAAQLAQTRALSAKVEKLTGELEGLEGKIATLEGAQNQGLEGLGAQMDGLGQSLSGSLEQLGQGLSTVLKSQIDELRDRLAGGSGSGAAPTTITLEPGETAQLDAGLELFLAATDPATGTAMVALNGQTLVQLVLGRPYDTGGCRVELTGFDADGGAIVSGGC